MISRRIDRRQEEIRLGPVTDAAGLLALQAAVERIDVEASVGRYLVELAAATRSRPEVLVGASPRGALALMLCSRALAVISGRDYVTPDDVKAVAVAALGHRLTLRPETFLRRTSGDDVVRATFDDVPVPDHRRRCRAMPRRAGGAGPVGAPRSAWSSPEPDHGGGPLRCPRRRPGGRRTHLRPGRSGRARRPFLIGLVLAAGQSCPGHQGPRCACRQPGP